MPACSSRSSTPISAARRRSPCVDCNTYVKFGALLGRARHQYECEAVATGHYARRDVGPDGAGAAAPGARRGQGPDLLPVRPPPGPARPRPVPARRADQARGARGRARARPRDRRQAREPGDLLRPRRRLPRRPAGARGLGAGGRARCSTRDGDAGGGAWRHGGLHRRPAPGPRCRPRRAALREPDRPADQHDHARAPRGPRDDRRSSSSGRASSPATRRPVASRSGPRSGSVTDRRRSRRPCVPPRRTSRRAAGDGWSRPTRRSGPPRRARRPCSTTATWCIGGGRIARPMPTAPATRPRVDATQRPPGSRSEAAGEPRPGDHPVGPGRDLPRVAVRAHPRNGQRAPAGHRRGRDPRGVGRRRASPTGSVSTC